MVDVRGDAPATNSGDVATTAVRSAVADAYSPSAKVSLDTTARPHVISPDGQLIFSNVFGNNATTNTADSNTENNTTNRNTDNTDATANNSDSKVTKTDATGTAGDGTQPATTSSTPTDVQSAAAPAKPNPNWQAQGEALAQAEAHTATPADITANISPSDVAQGNLGDCYFSSALASMASSQQGQAAIRNMIKTNSDGSYTVTFPGDPSHPVTVTQQEINDQKVQLPGAVIPAGAVSDPGAVNDPGRWAQTIETAFMKYDGIGEFGTGTLSLQNSAEGNIPFLGSTSFADQALQLLTGQNVTTDSLGPLNAFGSNLEVTAGNTSSANTLSAIENALQTGEPVTATAVGNQFAVDLGEHAAESDMTSDHVYSVMSYNAQTGEITVRNPWGNNPKPWGTTSGITQDGITSGDNGELKMSFDTFTKYFNDVNIAGLNPYSNDQANTDADLATTSATLGTVANDLRSGNFGALSADTTNFANSATQSASDVEYEATDLSERTLEAYYAPDTSAMMNAVNSMWTPTQDLMVAANGMSIAAQNYGSNLLSDLNPNNWSLSL